MLAIRTSMIYCMLEQRSVQGLAASSATSAAAPGAQPQRGMIADRARELTTLQRHSPGDRTMKFHMLIGCRLPARGWILVPVDAI